MDDRVHEDYARQLLPRAVGYSASLINYFFRGQLGVTGSQGGLTVKNLTTETMSSGNISIYYDDPTSTRHLLSNYDLPSALNTGDQTPVIPFAIPTNNIRPGRYIVVFHGKLGEEEGAVIGKVTTEVIYYVSRRGGVDKIYRMDADGANPSRVYDNPDPTVLLAKLAPSPDAKTIAYTIATPTPPYFTIHLLNLADGTERFLTQGNWPSWSPDGSRLVFERDVGVGGDSDIELFAMEMVTGFETQLTQVPGLTVSSRAAWSPDGSRIAESKQDQAVCGSFLGPIIFLIDTLGNPVGPVTCSVGRTPDSLFPWNPYRIDGAPAWRADGQEIVFTRKRLDGIDQDTGVYRQFREELHKVTVAGEIVTKLTDSDGTVYSELTPAWSPDGRVIAVGSQRDADYDIWLVDPNGGGYVTNLTGDNPEMDGFPAYSWLP